MSTVRMFVNGQAMRGGTLHGALAGAEFLGAAETAARYRFRSFGDFPGLVPVADGGARIAGELYAVDYATLRDQLLPGEPPELELSVIELADGTGSCSMVVRVGETGGTDITEHGSWAAACAAGAA
ncbi:allophanate hydrolase-related protein [Modestobacter versicolor]|uniref:allophanate hydrolase-related protein n=1 Tax=Modestobacter versicolor TaxID=429133 RepID=UPI0034DF829D